MVFAGKLRGYLKPLLWQYKKSSTSCIPCRVLRFDADLILSKSILDPSLDVDLPVTSATSSIGVKRVAVVDIGSAVSLTLSGCYLHSFPCCLTRAKYLIDHNLFQSNPSPTLRFFFVCLLWQRREGLWQGQSTRDSQFLTEWALLIWSVVRGEGETPQCLEVVRFSQASQFGRCTYCATRRR